MQKNHFLLVKKLKNTGSAQLWHWESVKSWTGGFLFLRPRRQWVNQISFRSRITTTLFLDETTVFIKLWWYIPFIFL